MENNCNFRCVLIYSIYKIYYRTWYLFVYSEGGFFKNKVNAYLVSRKRNEDFNEQKTF